MAKILGIIPARGGSKSIPNKNIVDLNGNPLIYYTLIEALKAKNSGFIDELIVSTDSTMIKEICERYGVNVPFLRPRNISGDRAKSIDLVLHAIEFYSEKKIFFDTILLLQPTSPFRTFKDLKASIKIYESKNADSLISCYSEDYVHPEVMYENEQGYGNPLSQSHNHGHRKQDVKDVYVRNGAIYISDINYLQNNQKLISDKPALYVMPKERSVNIDSRFDLELARCLTRRLI